MSKEKITIGKVGSEDWVGTNDGGIGQLLFKLQDAKEVKDGLKKAHEHAKELGCRLYAAEKENAALREMLDVICSRLNEDGVNTDNIGADLLRGQKLLSELGGGDDL